jgi:hypothetical protein
LATARGYRALALGAQGAPHRELQCRPWEYPLDSVNGWHIWTALTEALEAAEAAESARQQVAAVK